MKLSDQVVLQSVIEPIGGVDKFRLVACPGFKLIQYSDLEGDFLDLVIEDDDLANATVSLLERSGVAVITRAHNQ